MGSRLFGRCWHAGDVVGCMINMEDKSMIFTLNGELLITNKGSELCFADFETEDGKCSSGSAKLHSPLFLIPFLQSPLSFFVYLFAFHVGSQKCLKKAESKTLKVCLATFITCSSGYAGKCFNA